jgi:hypothetical protein
MSINELTIELKRFFSKNELKNIAKQNNFIIRERKIKALAFIKAIMIAGIKDNHSSFDAYA